MQSINNFIFEKLRISSKSSCLTYASLADCTCYNLKDLKNVDSNLFDTQILSFIHGFIKEWPVYVYKNADLHNEKNEMVQQSRKYHEKEFSSSKHFKPNTFSSGNTYVVILSYGEHQEYNEIYICERDKNENPVNSKVLIILPSN